VTDFISKLKALSNRRDGLNSSKPAPKTSRSNGQNGNNTAPSAPSSVPLFAKTQGSSARAKVNRQPSSPPPNGNGHRQPEQMPPQRPLYQRWWAWVILGVGAGAAGVSIASFEALRTIERDLPAAKEVLTFARSGTMTIRSSDGTILQQIGPATRDSLTFEQIPDNLKQAFISSEDQNFYEHNGIDYPAIVRAMLANITAGEVVEGGSTITQQLARIVFLDQERKLQRKVREALLAQKIEQDLTKQDILSRYLNLVYLGSGAYGVADAAWIYFGKPASQLTLGEAAMIAGLAPAPSSYSPLVNLEAATQRRNTVLQRMERSGYISEAEMNTAMAEEVNLQPKLPRNINSRVPYFTSYIQQQLAELVPPEELETGGLTVYTTLNLVWQNQAQDTVNNAIRRYGPGQRFEQAAIVSIDPRNGEIKALVGGSDFGESQFNRATQAQRQPGSTFKTFVYATGVAAGFSPYKSYVDAKLVVDGYEPQNYGRSYRGSVTMREALQSSINIVAVKALIDIGFDPVIKMAQRMGIQSELIPAYSLALGSSEVNLLELTSAYGTLAAQGKYVEPHGIRRITNRYGEVIYEAEIKPEQAIDADSAAIMTWMLRGVVEEGTGGNANLPDRAVAGKTGTSERRRDLWFVGYVPQLVTGVWLGNDDSSPTWGASSTAARVWRNFMVETVDAFPPASFPSLPQLNGRKKSIEAEPVRPRRISASRASNNDEEEEDTRRTERRRSRSRSEDTAQRDESPRESSRRESSSSDEPRRERSAPPPPPEPVVRDEPTPVTEAAAEPPPAPAPAPVAVEEPPAPPPPPPPIVTPIQPTSDPVPLTAPQVSP
jgi:penicillin-binding protein 1A